MDYSISNTANITNSIDELITFPPYWTVVLRYVIIWIVDIIGLVGNCMIIIAVACSKKLQTSTNAFVTSLAVTDLLTCLVVLMDLIVVKFLSLPPKRVNGICQVFGLLTYSFVGTSLFTLGAIGINRLILITKPQLFRKIFSSWKLGIIVAMLWIIPGGSLFSAMINGVGAFGYDPVDKDCGKVNSHERAADLDLVVFAVGFPIPVTAVIVSYSWIYIHLKNHFKTQKKHFVNLQATSPVCSRSTSSLSRTQEPVVNDDAEIVATNPRKKEISRQQIQITKNLFLVVCIFFICVVPFCSVLLVDKPSPAVKTLSSFLELLVFANSAMNSFIYASKHPDFKIVLGHMIRCSYSKIPQPSRLLKFLLSRENQ